MKLLAIFLLLFVAAASATNENSSDYGLLEGLESFIGQFAEKVRQHLQQVLNKLKEKIQEHKHIFEALKDQIGAIQTRILQLAKDKVIEKAREIRSQLFNLLKKFLGKLFLEEEKSIGYALYEVEEGVLDRSAARIKASLERLLATALEQVEKYKDIANDIKDKVLAIKEKLQEIPKAGALRLLEIARKVKEQIKDLLTEIFEKIRQKEGGVSSYALYESSDETFLDRLSKKIQSSLENFLNRIVKLVDKYADIADGIKEKVLAIKEKIQEIPKAGFSKLLEISGKIKEQLQALLKEAIDKVSGKHEEAVGYSLYDAEEGVLDRLAARIKASLERFLATAMEKVEKYKDIANSIKDKVLAIKEKLQEIPKAGAFKLLEIASKVKEQIKDLLAEVIEKITQKEDNAYALYDGSGETFLDRLSQKIQASLQNFLNRIVELVDKYADIADGIKDKVVAIKEKIQEIPKAGLAKLLEISGKIKEQLQALLRETIDKIAGKHEEPAGYSLYDSEEESVLDRLAARIKASLEKFLATALEKVEKYKDIANDIKNKVLAIKEKLQEIPKAGAFKLLEIARHVKEQIKDLLTEVVEKISQKEDEAIVYSLYETSFSDDSFLDRLSRKIQVSLQNFLARIVKLVNKFTDIGDAIRDKVLAIKEKIKEFPKAGLAKMLEIYGQIKEQLQSLLKKAIDKIAGKHEEAVTYSLYDSEGGILQRLADKIRERFENVVETIQKRLETFNVFAVEFKEKIQAIKEKLQELTTASGAKLLEIARNIQQQLKELLIDAWDKINNKQVAEYSLMSLGGETMIESFGRVLRERLQAILNAIKDRLEQHKDVFETVKAKVEEIQEHINNLSKMAMSKAISVARVIKSKLAELIKAIGDKVGGITMISF